MSTLKYSFYAILILLFVPALALAAKPKTTPITSCQHFDFLTDGIDINDYQQCQNIIQACPKAGPAPDLKCVKRTIKNNAVCKELGQLSDAVKMPASFVAVKPVGKFNVVTITYIADGQRQFYITTPYGCLINTIVDPRQLSPALTKQYKGKSFMIVNWDEPQYQKQPNGMQSFTVNLRVTDTCLACKLIGFAKIRFDFTKNGGFVGPTLASFGDKT